MNTPKTIEFGSLKYFDDRMFVLYLCKGKVDINSKDGIVSTTIYHDKAPDEHVWCVATYRNCNRYPMVRVDSFYKEDDAISYLKEIEPETPLISLGGKSPFNVVSYEEYLSWKKENNFKEYDWRKMYLPGTANASEVGLSTIEQFKGIR